MKTKMGQDQLVSYLVSEGNIRSHRVQAVMRMVDRRHFVSTQHVPLSAVYEDAPQFNGQGQTISAPHMHAICLEQLQSHLLPGARVLDVGSGSGYLTACMALLVGPTGYVLGMDKMKELVERSVGSMARASPQLSGTTAASGAAALQLQGATVLGSGTNWALCHGNVLSDLLKDQQPFSAIHVGAAAAEMPQQLLDVLSPGGRMVVPVGPDGGEQVLMIVDKDDKGQVHSRKLMGVHFVPLTPP